MLDSAALTLCAFSEANTEPDDGVAAVCKVILNRAARHYQSDGTIQGAIFHPAAFSWTQYEMVVGHYTKVAYTSIEILARAEKLLAEARMYNKAWMRCSDISGHVVDGTYMGPDYSKITSDTVLYVNLAISHPVWALPEKLVANIGRHSFYRN